jgi:hypothetical protein
MDSEGSVDVDKAMRGDDDEERRAVRYCKGVRFILLRDEPRESWSDDVDVDVDVESRPVQLPEVPKYQVPSLQCPRD